MFASAKPNLSVLVLVEFKLTFLFAHEQFYHRRSCLAGSRAGCQSGHETEMKAVRDVLERQLVIYCAGLTYLA